ncbi:hypothetical protein BDW02DRAFT_645687 [Decorospora gaudefroyi]|uniref:Pre-mRNA-splicing factor CWC26 n=1 Tax=Decorospora gaudefroyi TaxID=184978 RepID=A0A6A5KLR1_9PLEO|nr:hypothetical protein BDW02DRAFT_645687 [Decorospora gaudefroyi]
MSGLADYLAKNYLTAASEKKSSSKKRKRKNKDGGLVIEDDDHLGWKDNDDDDDDEDAPMIVGPSGNTQHRKPKKKSKKSTSSSNSATPWTSIGVAAPTHAHQLAADTAAADAIIASTASDRQKALEAEDAAPQIVDTNGTTTTTTTASITHPKPGLQTAAQLRAATTAAQKQSEHAAAAAAAPPTETIYRDASGRVINLTKARQSTTQTQQATAQKAQNLRRAALGATQNEQKAAAQKRLRDAKTMTVARHADDVEMNDELKTHSHWNDPAMGFLRSKKEGRSVTGKPLFKGSFQQNRYGVRPGHRWDGLDRGNGFERLWFEARNRKADVQTLEYQWQRDE